jgi:hypothetical protein
MKRSFSVIVLMLVFFAPAVLANTGTGPQAVEVFHGDNLWNIQCGPDYDRGHDNYGPVPPPAFDVTWSPVYTRPSGTNECGAWRTDPKGRIELSAGQDTANLFWTYLYVEEDTILEVPYMTTGEAGVWINENYGDDVGHVWPLQAGWNVVEITLYDQNEHPQFDLNFELADDVKIMDSSY